MIIMLHFPIEMFRLLVQKSEQIYYFNIKDLGKDKFIPSYKEQLLKCFHEQVTKHNITEIHTDYCTNEIF